MIDQEETLKRTGEQIAGLLGEGPDREEIEAQRAGLLGAVRRAARRKRLVRSISAGAAVALVAAVAAIAIARLKPAPMAYSIGSESNSRAQARWFSNDAVSPLLAAFGDGSRVTFAAGARGRVIQSTTRDVHLLLEQGSLDADIKSAGNVKWEIDAGPFSVRVTGTAFNMRWDPVSAVLHVGVSRGTVVVFGIAGHAQGLTLSQGQLLRAAGAVVRITPLVSADVATGNDLRERDEKTPDFSTRRTPKDGESPEVAAAAAQRKPKPAAPAGATQKTAAIEAAPTPPPKPWVALYKQGKYAEAIKDASAEGFETLVGTVGVEDLWVLAESARYSRDAERSRIALNAIRLRFPESGEAKTAAFLLGRVTMESDGRPDEAARWFKVYRTELPGGPLDEEAAGRLIDALVKAQKTAEARAAAREYLNRYPNGIFAELARSAARD
ncbi:MAG: FecR domain-containing protein [Deltaproteobacteria bacterium]|nr:FecR domain-containing protein [Deltaproteobacteria bacterium]